LVRLSNGEEAVLNELLPAVYTELRQIAHNQLRGEQENVTLRTTELVHEAYMKLVDHAAIDWQDRQHFFAVAARAMRQVLVDHARRRTARKRGGSGPDLPLDDVALPGEGGSGEGIMKGRSKGPAALLALNDALDALAEKDDRMAKVVECRFFGGYTIQETADVLDVSPSTVKRDWRSARAWLNRALKPPDAGASPSGTDEG
jgi:RNA polymerase sigma factor (TIGR02999 family)